MSEFAALYVRADGPYPAMTEHWYDVERDARSYDLGLPVVAHPPCKRWGNYWYRDGSTEPGNDGGMFEHALSQLRRCGGVLEHPAVSRAFKAFDIPTPAHGYWGRSICGLWTTSVYQSAYGHRAEKLTWLAFCGRDPAPIDWSRPPGPHVEVENMGKPERELTPQPFADMLAGLATGGRVSHG